MYLCYPMQLGIHYTWIEGPEPNTFTEQLITSVHLPSWYHFKHVQWNPPGHKHILFMLKSLQRLCDSLQLSLLHTFPALPWQRANKQGCTQGNLSTCHSAQIKYSLLSTNKVPYVKNTNTDTA